jgi:deoxycytidine triphosphate deaminase
VSAGVVESMGPGKIMMGFLVSQQIKDLIGEGVVENVNLDECLAPASYQMRVGSYLESEKAAATELKSGEAVVVPPDAVLLIGTLEQVKFPKNLVGFLYLRSSYARRGLLPWSQGIIERGYVGAITVVLHNHSKSYIPIVGGQKICHLMFSPASTDTAQPYSDIYQNSRTATPSKESGILKVVGTLAGEGIEHATAGLAKGLMSSS